MRRLDRGQQVQAQSGIERLSGGRHDETHSGNDGTYSVGMTNAPILAERVRIVVTKPGYGSVTHEFAPNQVHTI